jgi:hypothetical protein
MWKKLRNMIADSCDLLELLMAVIVLLATIVAIVSLWQPFIEFLKSRYESEALPTISESSNIFISDDEWDAFKKKRKERRENK